MRSTFSSSRTSPRFFSSRASPLVVGGLEFLEGDAEVVVVAARGNTGFVLRRGIGDIKIHRVLLVVMVVKYQDRRRLFARRIFILRAS